MGAWPSVPSDPVPFGHRTLCQLWRECGGRGHRLHRHGPGVPRGVLRLHDLWHQASRKALLCYGEKGLLRAVLHCEYPGRPICHNV